MSTLISQSEFARLCGVSRQRISVLIGEGRLYAVGKKIDSDHIDNLWMLESDPPSPDSGKHRYARRSSPKKSPTPKPPKLYDRKSSDHLDRFDVPPESELSESRFPGSEATGHESPDSGPPGVGGSDIESSSKSRRINEMRKLKEEIRKLQMVNDKMAGTLILKEEVESTYHEAFLATHSADNGFFTPSIEELVLLINSGASSSSVNDFLLSQQLESKDSACQAFSRLVKKKIHTSDLSSPG